MQFIPVSIPDETAPLKQAAVFGPPGIEAYLAQFLPPEESLFLQNFDVGKAQEEYLQFIQLMGSMGVEVVNLKRAYASLLETSSLTSQHLIGLIQQQHPMAETKMLESLLHADALMVGEEKAVALNYSLSIEHGFP